MALMAHDSDDYVDQLILLTSRLADLANKQAALFDANQFDDAQKLQEEIGRLSATYLMEAQRLARQSEALTPASTALKEKLKVESRRFAEAMAHHEAILARRTLITEGLVRAIAEEAVAARPQAVAYGPGAARSRDASAVTLDKRA